MVAVVAMLSVGAVAAMLWYLIRSRPDRRLSRPRRMVPPDDDPDFLADIARRARPDDK